MAALLAGSVLALATAAYAAPVIITGTNLPATTIQAAGGSPLIPGTISSNAIGAFQVANFLENLVCSKRVSEETISVLTQSLGIQLLPSWFGQSFGMGYCRIYRERQ